MDTSEEYVADSNEVIQFKLIRNASDIQDSSIAFKPLMSHQIFGSKEKIFGYKNLKISIYFSAAQLNPYLGITYSDKVNQNSQESMEADNIHDILTQKLEISFNDNVDDFIRSLEKEVKFKPPGQLKETFTFDIEEDGITNGAVKQKTYEVYYCEISTPGLLHYHKRLQTFILWFIDAASYIDTDDEKWKFFLMFEKYKSDAGIMYAIVGYATVYEYYAYPMNIRPRISQVLVLPPFQRRGLGASLLTAIYNHYKLVSNVTDITVEDPSEDLQLVRDYVDCKNCLGLKSFHSDELWSKGFNNEMVTEAATNFKINKVKKKIHFVNNFNFFLQIFIFFFLLFIFQKQARRVYEILKLKTVNKNNANQYKQYRLEIKKRLNVPFQHEQNKLKKLEAFMKSQDFAEMKAAITLSDEQRLSNLEKSYKELEEQYERVLKRLDYD